MMTTMTMAPTFSVRIEQDDDPTRPDDWDNVAEILLDVRGYVDVNTARVNVRAIQDAGDPVEYLRVNHGALFVVPVYAYCHSGVTIRAAESNPYACPWDSGVAGFAWTTREHLDTLGVLDGNAVEQIRADVNAWDQYLTGDVWSVSVVNDATGETVESVCGVYGYAYAEEEGEGMLAAVRRAESLAMAHGWTD